jgi:cell division protein FtsX
MRAAFAVWRLLARRSLATWRLTALLALGVLVAAMLLAAAPLYARAMADLGLTFAVRDRLQREPTTEVQLPAVAVASAEGRALQQAVARRAEERLGWFTAARGRLAQGPRFQIIDPAEPGRPPPLLVPWTVSDAGQHVRLLAGRLPGPRRGTEEPIEIALSPRAAEAAGLRPGDRLTLLEAFDDCERELPREDRPPPPPCTPKVGVRFTLTAELVGLIEPVDPESPFWVRGAATLFEPYRLIPDFGPLLPALTDEETFFAGLGAVLPEYRATVSWVFIAGPERLSRATFPRARADIADLREELKAVGGFAFSPLESVLTGFGRELPVQETPLVLLLLQIAGIALLYVAVIAALSVERQAQEIALLRARGASRFQVLGLFLFEGMALALPATLLAPFLAAGAVALLGFSPALRRVTGGAALPLMPAPEAFLLAALGAALALLMLLGAAALSPAFGHPSPAHGRGTGGEGPRVARPRPPMFTRYYLDVALAVLALLLLWEVHERGSVFTPSPTGGVSSDPLLLLSPALLTVAAATLVLRLAPLLLRLAAALAGALAGPPLVLGLWRLVRDPAGYIRLALLLMTAVAIGTFAASSSHTAERSFRDRAAFAAGADLRLAVGDTSRGPNELAAELAAFPFVERVALAVRATAAPATPGAVRQDIALLALDPEAAPDLLWFREDFARVSLAQLLAPLRGPAPPGRPLPGAPTAVRVWVNPMQPRESVTMWVRVRDARGTTVMAELGKLDFAGWRQLRAALTGPSLPELQPPLFLLSIVFSEPSNIPVSQPAPIYLDDIAVEEAGRETVVEDFEGVVRWQAKPDAAPLRGGSVQDDFRVTGEDRHRGTAAGRFTFRPGLTTGLRGLFAADLTAPLPVIASPEFVAITGAGPGRTTLLQTGDVVTPVIVRDVARLFPTVPAGVPFVIAAREQLQAWLAAFSDGPLRRPNEAWLRLRPGADREAALRTLTTSPLRLSVLADRERALRSVGANPLIAAGGSGILVLSALAAFALVTAALLVTLTVSVQRRQTEFAVLRAVGLAPRQIMGLLGVEYGLVALIGTGAGITLGLAVSRRMLSFLDVTETGQPVVPPFILQTNWPALGAAGAALALVFVVGMLLSVLTVLRQPPTQVLRLTE